MSEFIVCQNSLGDKIANSLVVGRMGRERNLIRGIVKDGFYKDGMDKSAKNYLGLRTLTVKECARLQGFPKGFVIPVSDNQAYRQLGNTVSIPVIKVIARKIKKTLDKIYEPDTDKSLIMEKIQSFATVTA